MLLDLSSIDAPAKMGVLPPGEYSVQVTEAEVKSTKSGGRMIKLKFKVSDGEFKGRTLYNTFNIENASKDAERIGKEQLKGFMLAAGMDGNALNSVVDLQGRKALAITKIGQDMKGNDVPEIKYFDALPVQSDGIL